MPEHEPEVIAAARRCKPLDSRIVLDDGFGDQQALCCPRCGYQFMHRGPHHKTSSNKDVQFSCEECGDAAAFELVITDCKGNVFIEWREPK
jgi:hypothetical protein